MRCCIATVRVFALATSLGLVAACADPSGFGCRVDADCASGTCNPDGTCLVEARGPESGPGFGPAAAAPDPNAGDRNPGEPSGTSTEGCLPNFDGRISRSEMIVGPGLSAPFRVATNVTVPATTDPDRSRHFDRAVDPDVRWDLSTQWQDEIHVDVVTEAPSAWWFGPDYPDAGWVSRPSQRTDLRAAFVADEQGLWMLGMASPDAGLFHTRLAYSPASPVLRWPLEVGAAWSETLEVSGIADGLLVGWTEEVTSQVDARGRVAIPFGTYDALRVRTVTRRHLPTGPSVSRVDTWVAECVGVVAIVASHEGETDPDFQHAAEVRRLGP